MSYFRIKGKWILFYLFLCFSYNLYFIFLLPEAKTKYLIYIDFLLGAASLFLGIIDFLNYHSEDKKKTKFLNLDMVVYQEFPNTADYAVAKHDVEVLQRQLQDQFEANCDLQDYIAKWCHEVKIPLSASLLMNEKIEDSTLRLSMQEQLERIHQQLATVLLGCKMQSSLFDIQIKSIRLFDCVKTSVRNNSFFLIKNHFQVEIEEADIVVFSDKNWLVYILDQIINNAIKYATKQPLLKIWSVKQDKTASLFVEDHGEGIGDGDIRRIFEKGYTGSNHHNGKYKSTGMGLYMTAKIVEKLGHQISVESEEGQYTRFKLELLCYGDTFQAVS